MPGLLVLAIAAAGGSVFHVAEGSTLGHYQTTTSIRTALGRTLVDGRCELVYPTAGGSVLVY